MLKDFNKASTHGPPQPLHKGCREKSPGLINIWARCFARESPLAWYSPPFPFWYGFGGFTFFFHFFLPENPPINFTRLVGTFRGTSCCLFFLIIPSVYIHLSITDPWLTRMGKDESLVVRTSVGIGSLTTRRKLSHLAVIIPLLKV